MELTWLGTAGFIVNGKEGEIAFDPFLSRGQGKPSPFTSKDFENTESIYVGHGHFDHTFDLPQIVGKTEVNVYAPGLTGQLLKMRGVPKSRLHLAQNRDYLHSDFKLQGFKSSHVRFDVPLIWSTMKRCGVQGCLHIGGLGISYPQGLVQSYVFQCGGKKVLFLSSAGASKEELMTYRNLGIDIFLAPLQGHSQIQSLAAEQTAIINPKLVIPHHHDDFYPPLSQEISAAIFKEELQRHGYKGSFLEIPLFDKVQI